MHFGTKTESPKSWGLLGVLPNKWHKLWNGKKLVVIGRLSEQTLLQQTRSFNCEIRRFLNVFKRWICFSLVLSNSESTCKSPVLTGQLATKFPLLSGFLLLFCIIRIQSAISSLRHILPVCQKGVVYPLLFTLLFLTTSQLGDLSPTYLRPSLWGVCFLHHLQNFFKANFFSSACFDLWVK